jgi:2'-5' RNA ligase
MRLFLGLDLPDSVKHKISTYLSPIKKSEKGWESPHDYHQTLLFIGEAGPEEEDSIKERMNKIIFPAFKLVPTTFQFFNRRVMYLGIEKTPELLDFKLIINEAFPEWAIKETKSFHPHITVKRWQRYEHADLVEGLSKEPLKLESFKIETLSLFKSEKDAHNHKYHVIYHVPLSSPN